MDYTTLSHPGQNNGTGDVRANFQKEFSGELMLEFENMNIGLGTVTVQTIKGAGSKQFITIANKAAGALVAHTPGALVVPTITKNDEVIITVGTKYATADFIDVLEDSLSSFDAIPQYAKKQAYLISDQIDTDIFAGIYNSRLATPKAGQTASIVVTDTAIALGATDAVQGNALTKAFMTARASLNKNNVPTQGRIIVTDEDQFMKLILADKVINVDYNPNGNGSMAEGTVTMVAGMPVKRTNNLPAFNLDGITASNLAALIYTPDVFGVLKALDIKTSIKVDNDDNLGTKITSYYAMGMGTLNPSCLAVIKYA